MTKFKIGDKVKYIGREIKEGISPDSIGTIQGIFGGVLLLSPPLNVYEVEFNGGTIELNDVVLKLAESIIEKEPSLRDPNEIPYFAWMKIIESLEICIDIQLEDGNPEKAIRYAILLEETCKASLLEEYSFEGKLDVR